MSKTLTKYFRKDVWEMRVIVEEEDYQIISTKVLVLRRLFWAGGYDRSELLKTIDNLLGVAGLQDYLVQLQKECRLFETEIRSKKFHKGEKDFLDATIWCYSWPDKPLVSHKYLGYISWKQLKTLRKVLDKVAKYVFAEKE